ncbi:hypothetical protein KM043_009861 [Ampulex compressa]|nr:hypothetical protein KM043_009861 [Ampulex compressa]
MGNNYRRSGELIAAHAQSRRSRDTADGPMERKSSSATEKPRQMFPHLPAQRGVFNQDHVQDPERASWSRKIGACTRRSGLQVLARSLRSAESAAELQNTLQPSDGVQ